MQWYLEGELRIGEIRMIGLKLYWYLADGEAALVVYAAHKQGLAVLGLAAREGTWWHVRAACRDPTVGTADQHLSKAMT